MTGSDLLFWFGILCLFVVVLLFLYLVVEEIVFDLRGHKRDLDKRRKEYQGRIRGVIYFMVDMPEFAPRVEWELHSLLYEYRRL